MTLLQMYQKHTRLLEFFLQKANDSKSWDVRDSFRDRALEHQMSAGYIAHCIALFGDLVLSEANIEALEVQVKDKGVLFENPWTAGIAIMRKELSSMT